MRKDVRRPPPAMVVAILALVTALGGTAVAGGVLNKKKVNKIITNRAPGLSVRHAATAGTADQATNAEQLGGQVAGSFQSRIRWAFVSASGAILAQSGGISNDAHDPGTCPTGCDFLNFGSNQVGKAVLLTLHDPGEVRAAVCGGSGNPGGTNCTVSYDDTHHILVRGSNSGGADANLAYWIAMVG